MRRPADPHLRERVLTVLVTALPGLTFEAAQAALTSAGAASGICLRHLDDHFAAYPDAPLALGTAPPLPLTRLARTLIDLGYPIPRPRCARFGNLDRELRHLRDIGPVCKPCSKVGRERQCVRCGRPRTIVWRAPEGDVCDSCCSTDPGKHAACSVCHEVRRVNVRFEDGRVHCQRCYQRPERTCAVCGQHTRGHAITDAGPICTSCYYQQRRPWRVCGRCGRLRRIACRATATTPDICDSCHRGGEAECTACGRVRPGFQYRGVFLCRSCAPRPLRECARCHRLRSVSAEWPLGHFLTWLDEQQLDLAAAKQQHIDERLTTGQSAYHLRSFIKWTNQRGLTTGLIVPALPRAALSRFLTEEQRWSQLRECLNNTAIPTRVRAAGALILLLGIGITRVLQLTAEDITIGNDDQVSIALGKQPIPLPPRVGALFLSLVEHPEHVSTLKPADSAKLLFPGRPPSRPLNPHAFSYTLIRFGITAHTGRNAALIDLASDVPAPILADLLGIRASTAVKWNIITGRDWTTYLQARGEGSSYQNTQR